jgi:hypothetical protein
VINHLFKFIVCKFKTHIMIDAGACPFTGKSYNSCTRCGATKVK